MADENYKRLGCISTGCTGKHKANGLCATHYMRLKRTGFIDHACISCTHCGKEFEAQRSVSMYCSNACKVAAWKAKNGRIEYEYIKRVSSYWAGYCIDCNIAIGGVRKRCRCGDCQGVADKAYNTARSLADAEMKHKAAGLVISCDGCSVLFCPLYGASNTRLCLCCKTDRGLQAKRTSRLTRKMRQRCQTVESVNPLKVFDRDKWTCQLCKKKTPKSLRGSLDPRAPELDHIMPVSLGGEHSYRNTQCSCRACNGSKSNRPLGQMLLIG